MSRKRALRSDMAGSQTDRAWEVQLMRGLATGKDSAVELLIESYQGPLFRFVWRRVTPNRPDAEEILQDTLLAAVRSAGSYDGKAALFTWLCGIACHKIADYYRRQGRQPLAVSSDDCDEPYTTSDCLDFTDELALREAIEMTMQELPEHYRHLLYDKYESQKTAQEMANERGTSLKAIESVLARARVAFGTKFERLWGRL